MYNKRQPLDYLNDILESVNDIREFTKDMRYEDFIGDRKTLKAVIRCFEVIAEATKALPSDIKENHKKIPWAEIVGMRNKLIHEYFGIDTEILWQSIQEDLEPLESTVKTIFLDLK
ncbi:MAG TPA: DUF86 domain-containing protein [Syntrophorhabdaceae bacterium]|nr:DUF86 domain-containing protein [Syntrophorhabdaceae bacterium]